MKTQALNSLTFFLFVSDVNTLWQTQDLSLRKVHLNIDEKSVFV